MASPLDELVDPIDETEQHFQQVSQARGMQGTALDERPPPQAALSPEDQINQQAGQIFQRLPYQGRADARRSELQLQGLRFQREQLRQDQLGQERGARAEAASNRLKAADLADRGIPTFRNASGGVSPVTEPDTGEPLLHHDPKNDIAYDSKGEPKAISYESETGPPVLRDPFENIQPETDVKTGDIYKKRPGLPWQWQGSDEGIKAQRMQETKDKALKAEAALVGRKLTLDHADLVAGGAENKQMTKELQAAVPSLQDPKLQGADRGTILKAIDDHFNNEYGQPEANETNGWFSKDLSPGAQQLRQSIDARKASATDTANNLFDLKDRQLELGDKVAAGRELAGKEVDTLIAHGRGEQGPLDQPPAVETAPSETVPVGPDAAIAEAKAGNKPYTVDDQNNIQFDPKNVGASAAQAAQDGLIDPKRFAELKPQLDALQKATDDRDKLIAAAGNNPRLTALLSGAVKGSAFAAGFPLGFGIGATAGAFGGPFDPLTIPIGGTIGGLITGTIASKGAEAIIKKVGEYNDTIHSLSAASELHPNYDLGGNLVSFGAGAFTKGAAKGVGAAFEALGGKLAGASAVEGATAEAVTANVQRATAISRAAAKGEKVGAASEKWAADVLSKTDAASTAAKYANAISRSYYGSGGGLINTIQNLKNDASIRAAQLGDQPGAQAQIAKAIGYKVGVAAAANVAIDAIVNQGLYAVGAQPQGETWQNAGAAALLGAFTAGHGMEVEGYNKDQMSNILLRGKVRIDNGIGLAEPLPPGLIERKMPHLDSQEAAAFHAPLTPKEQEVWEAFGRKALELEKAGQLPNGIASIADMTARQSLVGGQPIGVAAAEIRPGEGGAPPPEAPAVPRVGGPEAPTTEPPAAPVPAPPAPAPAGETPAPIVPAPPGIVPPAAPVPAPIPPTPAPTTEGVPPSEEVTPAPQPTPEPAGQPAVQPPRGGGAPPEQVGPNAPAGGSAAAPIAPAGNVPPAAPAGPTGGAVVPGGPAAPVTEGGPPAVPAPPTVKPGEKAPEPPTVPGAVKTVDEAAHQAATSPQNELAEPTPEQKAAGNYQKGHVEIGPEGGTKIRVAFENPAGSQRSNLDLAGLRDIADTPAAKGGQAGGIINSALDAASKGDYQTAKQSLESAADDLRLRQFDKLADSVEKIDTGSFAQPLGSHYGYVKGTVGADKDHVDVFVKPGTPTNYDGPVYVVDQTTHGGNAKNFDEHKAIIGVSSGMDAVEEYRKNYDAAHRDNYSGVTQFPNIAAFKAWAESGAKGPAAETKGIAKAPAGAQPPVSGPKQETLPPAETPPAGGEGAPGAGEGVQQAGAAHDEAERTVQEFHAALPRGIRVSHLSGRNVPLVRVAPDKLPGGGIGARWHSNGDVDLVHAPEVVAQSLADQTATEIERGKTPEEAKAAALDLFRRGMVGEAGHARQLIVSGANIVKDRERFWKEMDPQARRLMPEVYDVELPKESRNRTLSAEYARMKFQLAHGIMPEEADINPEAFAKLLPFLHAKESPWIESHLRAMDDLTKQDTELPFRSDELNELYKFHEKKGLSDAQAQAAVIEDVVAGYDDIQEALDAADAAPPDHVHTTESDHEISNEAFREAVERAKEAEDDPKPVVMPPKPEVLSKVPRRPPTVPESIGGPGPISDIDISQAEVVPGFEGTGDLGHDYIQMPDGERIGVTFVVNDVRLHPDNPDNEQPDASAKETQDWLVSKSGKNYDDRQPLARDPTFLTGPTVSIRVEGRYKTISGHRRKYLRLINREKYEAALLKGAAKFGINPKFVETILEKGGWPYLSARVDDILTPEQESALGRYLNTTKEQPKLPVFEAISAGRQLTPETLDTAGHLFEQNFEAPPLKMLKSAAARDLVAAMFKDGALRESDRGKYIADNGAFTEEGAKFARLVLVGHIIDDVQVLDSIQNTKAMTKLINGLSQLMIMKRRGQDMDKITQMLRLEYERLGGGDDNKKLTMLQYYQQKDQLLFDRRDLGVEAIHQWFNSFEPAQAKKAFLKALNDYLPLEKGQEDMVAKNVDLGEGLIINKNLETLSMMKPGKGGGMTARELVLKTLKEKEAKGKKLTPAEHDLVLKIEKKLGQKLLIDPNKTPRKEQEPDVFPEETPPVEPKRAVLGGQTDLDIISQGIEKSGQQTLFMLKPKSQPPARPKYGVPGEATTLEKEIAKSKKYDDDLAKWLATVPPNQPLVFTNPERPERAAYVTPVIPRGAAPAGKAFPKPTKEGDYRVTWFERLGWGKTEIGAPAEKSYIEPTGHDEHRSKIEAVKSALAGYPQFAPETLFMAKPKPPDLPGFGNLPEIQWKEGPSGDIWDGVATKTGVGYMITKVGENEFQIHYFNPDGGGASAIGSQTDLPTAKKEAETHYAMWKADNRNRPARSESIKLVGPRAKTAKEHPELRLYGDEKKRIAQNNPVSLQISREGMTQTSPVNFLPARFLKIAKPHQQHGSNLALRAFDGGTGFLNNDGPGAGKTVQLLMVAHIMADTKAKVADPEGKVDNYSKEHGLSPRRHPLPEGMVHASLIVTENERIIQNAFAKDAEMLGIDVWRYMGDDPKPDRVYIATYNDLRSGRVRPGQFRTFLPDEAQGLRNAGYETAQALAGTQVSAMAQHVMYATATPFDKPEQIVYLEPLIGTQAVQDVFGSLGIEIKRGAVDPKTGKADIRFTYPDSVTAADIEKVKEAIFNELTRQGKMISRNVPLDNVKVNFVEVPLSDAAFLHADAMYQRIYGAVAQKSAQNAGGVAGMAVRGYLETQKIEAAMKLIRESMKEGRQVVIFASRIKEGTEGSYHEGIEGTLDKMFGMIEKEFGKGITGRVYGGDNKRSVESIDRFQRNEFKILLGTPNSAGTGINLDDIHGDTPRDMIIITAPLSAIEAIQDIGRINRLTTLSSGDVKFLFVDHPVDTWNLDILADKLITLSATVAGDLKNIKPLKQRTAEIKLNDDVVALMTMFQRAVFQREPVRIKKDLYYRKPTGFISEQEARDRLTSPNKEVREEAQAIADKYFKDIQDETDRQRNNEKQMSEDEIMALVDDEEAFSALSPGHAYFQQELAKFVKANSLYPTHAQMLRALGAQMKGDFLLRIDFSMRKMKPLGRGGGTYGGRGRLILQERGKKQKVNPYLSNDMGKVTLHEYGHVGYFVLLTVADRRFVARMYAKQGGRSGTQAYFVQGTPQAATSKSRYYSKNVYEWFAESFAQYVLEKRVPGEIMKRFFERILPQFKKNFEMLRRRKDITREPGLISIYEKILDLKKNAKDIDYSYPDRASMLLSTKPPKGLSRGEMERYLWHKASIYNSLALNRPPTYRQQHELEKGEPLYKPKFSTIQEKVGARVRPLPSGTEAIAPYAGGLALRGPLPKSLGGVPEPLRPTATETTPAGQKTHFYIKPTDGGYALLAGGPGEKPHLRTVRTRYEDAVEELRKTLREGAKFGGRSVWHQQPEGGEYASEITGTKGMGVRGEGGGVGEEASLRQPGEIARKGEEKIQEKPTGRSGELPVKDPNDPGQSGVIEPDTLNMLSPNQLKKVAGVNWVSGAISDIRGLAPTSKSPEHLQAAQDVGRFLGERNRQAEIARRRIRPSWQMFVKMGADREDLPYENHPGTEFAHAMSTGKAPRGSVSIPVMITKKMEADLKARGHTQEAINKMTPQEANDILRPAGLDKAFLLYEELLRERILAAEKAGAPLGKLKDHYFPGYWTVQSRRAFNQAIGEILTDKEKESFDANNTSEAKMAEIRTRVKELIKENADKASDTGWMAAFARRPLKGPEKFRHQSVFEDKLTAEKFGLEPTMPNPADAIMGKLHELDQSIMANKLFQKWTRDGKLRIIAPKSRPPEGWRKIPDPHGEVWAKDDQYGWRLVGERIVPDAYADIIENFLSKSLYDSPYLGKPFGLWMAFANVLNQTQLGIGSAFHAGFTSMEAQISSIARLMQEMYGVMRGNRTMGDFASTLKQVPTAMYSVPKEGDAVLNAYITKTPSQDPRINKIVRALELSGAGTSIEKGLRTNQIDKLYRDYYSGRKLRAAMRSPVAMIELMAKPIMDMLVPRQKLGVFSHEAQRIIDMNPGKSLEQLTPEFRFLWSTIDARLGQVQYKRLFANNVAKNVAQMFIRAPGWTGGTILQLGGAVKDAGNFFKEWHETGSLPKDLPPRTAYAISLVLMTAAMNAALTLMFTGRKPEDQDYWAFRTGREDEHGNPERFVLPTYMKDLYAYGKHPGETILNKTHPAISLFMELVRNKDYYGVEVRDPDANVVKQAYQSGKHVIAAFQPFWWRGAVRAGARGAQLPEKVLPLVGVMPAPRALTQTPAQAELESYWKTHRPESGISPEQFETQQTKRQLVRSIRQGRSPNLTEAIEKGAIKPRDIGDLYKRARLGSIASSVDRMPLDTAEKIYAKANAREREQLAGILERKRAGSLSRGGRTMYSGF